MAKKQFHVEIDFKDLPGGKMYQGVKVEATNAGMAAHHAFDEIRKRPAIKGTRSHTCVIRVVEIVPLKSPD